MDREYEIHAIEKVTHGEDGCTISFDGGTCFWVNKEYGPAPKVGDMARFHPGGLGRPVRGLFINGVEYFYRSPEEERKKNLANAEARDIEKKAEFEENRAEFNAQFRALPHVFQRRIEKFRLNNPDFRWEYESYELFCCLEAVKFAKHFINSSKRLLEWADSPYEEQLKEVEVDSNHSGNTFGCAVKLAYLYLTNPIGVIRAYGALAPLVGSEEYGCVSKVNYGAIKKEA
jgi:hypothetical protein